MAREFGSSKRLMGAVTLVGTTRSCPSSTGATRSSRGLGTRGSCGPRTAWCRLCALACVTPAAAPWALLLQLLHGPCFALAWSAAVSFAADATPPRLRATSQSALSTALRLGAGSAASSGPAPTDASARGRRTARRGPRRGGGRRAPPPARGRRGARRTRASPDQTRAGRPCHSGWGRVRWTTDASAGWVS